MKKRLVIILAGTGLVIVLVLAAGLGWFVGRIDDFLVPPADPSGQPSVATYTKSVAARPARPLARIAERFDWASIASPPISSRPWTRWWWPGGDVDATSVVEQLELLATAGFGGVEVQPFISGMIQFSGLPVMERVYQFDKPSYYEVLNVAMDAAERLGMQFDLTHFSGWPPGGPEINLEDSLTLVAYGETEVEGGEGESQRIGLPTPRPGAGEYIFAMMEFAGTDFMNFAVANARLLSVVAARIEGEGHSPNPFDLDDTVTLDAGSLQVLTDKVQGGVLEWEAPRGRWLVIASYLMPSGEVPMGAAQQPQGFVVDHLRLPQVIGHYEYAFGDRTGLPVHYGRGMRGLFNDSLEFRLKRMSVEGILEEFRARRGYDLEPYLPSVYVEGVDNVYFRELMGIHAAPEFALTPLDNRIRHDYQQTLSDLVIERFVAGSAQWAAERGLASRGQSYGMDIDIIRALGANTIPETEQLWAGGADVGLKFASSAAALYGRPLVSAESFVWINRDYTPTARRVKAAADKLFLAGINHIVYHGTPYPWDANDSDDFGDEGWAPFSGPQNPAHFSTNASPGNTALWPDVPALNAYIARSQNLLRQGNPAIDVLIYYPFLGFHGPNPDADLQEALVGGALPDADPTEVAAESPLLTAGREQLERIITTPPAQEDERVAWISRLQPLLWELDRRGISWGWINDHALQSGKLAAGRLNASGGSFGAIVLPNAGQIELDTLTALQGLARSGVPVFFSGNLPGRQPGFREAKLRDAAVRQAVEELLAGDARDLDFSSDAWVAALARLSTDTVRYQNDSAIRRYRRVLTGGGAIQFFSNLGAVPDTVELQVGSAEALWWFDAVDGAAWPAEPVNGRLSLSLSGFESRFLMVGVPMPDTLPRRLPGGMAVQLASQRWSLTDWDFALGDYRAKGATLRDWREVEALRHARGPGRYTHAFTLPGKAPGAQYLLDLGLVQGSASVSVNGVEVGRASLPPFLLDVTEVLAVGVNAIEVDVLAPLRNAFVGLALEGDARYSHMEEYRNQLVAAGLIGPVEVLEVRPPPAFEEARESGEPRQAVNGATRPSSVPAPRSAR
ncbi:MAG: hypothetical protein H6990_02335 [Pseudomonadales bacterium]|nr:hypothetical protein [Pseudomonadales bacterium]